jgi:hypothetical protein
MQHVFLGRCRFACWLDRVEDLGRMAVRSCFQCFPLFATVSVRSARLDWGSKAPFKNCFPVPFVLTRNKTQPPVSTTRRCVRNIETMLSTNQVWNKARSGRHKPRTALWSADRVSPLTSTRWLRSLSTLRRARQVLAVFLSNLERPAAAVGCTMETLRRLIELDKENGAQSRFIS